jgi:hypothetical protein
MDRRIATQQAISARLTSRSYWGAPKAAAKCAP